MPTITLTNNDDVLNLQGVDDGLVDTIYGLDGDDSILGDGVDLNDLEDDIIYGGLGTDTLSGAYGAATIFGGAGDDVLDNRTTQASAGVDTVYGGVGNDSIFGKRADDLIYGGDGNDNISSNQANLFLEPGQTLSELGDTVYGGNGDDTITTIDFTGANSSSVGDTVYGGAGNDSILGALQNPTPGVDNDLLFGGDGNDIIDGNGGTDSIDAGTGNDLVLARDGADTTDGGAGIDTIDFSGDAGAVEFNMATGATTVTGVGGTDVESNIDYENVIGSGLADSITGNAANNSIAGGAGADTLAGGLGSDTFVSGAGNDSIDGNEDPGDTDIDVIDYSAETAGVVVTYTGDEAGTAQGVGTGTDTFDNIERIIFTDQDDAVNASADNVGVTFDTGAGDDFVEAGQAADSLDGGSGGETDGDTLSYADSGAGVTLDVAAGTGSGGNADGDTFQNFENFDLSANDDNFNGSAGNDTVDAGAGNDNVQGGAGADSMDGGAGDGDVLDYSGSADAVTVDLGAQTATGGDATGDVFVNFEGATGTAGQDTIVGSDEDNTIDGGFGSDSLAGGDGDDTITAGGGQDVVSGGAGNDVITGDGGPDTIDGGAGNDTMSSGAEDDLFTVDENSGNDSILGGETVETIGDTISVAVPTGGSFIVAPDAGDPEGDAGQIFILDNLGNTVSTITYDEIENIVCFTRGTMVRTPSGDVAIEDLSEGDLVLTRDHGAQPIRWIGSQAVAATGKLAPVMIRKGALGNDRDLLVSQLHRMLVTDWRAELMFGEPEVLAAAKHLVNGDSIYVAEGGEVEYFHMLFDSHEIVTANGAASESFHPGEQGLGWLEEEMRKEIFAIFPELRVAMDGYGPAARTSLKAFEARALTR